MMIFTVEHKYCKCTRTIEGENVYRAFKENNMDMNIWVVIDVEEI